MFFDLSVDDRLVDPCRRYFDLNESLLLLFAFVYLLLVCFRPTLLWKLTALNTDDYIFCFYLYQLLGTQSLVQSSFNV